MMIKFNGWITDESHACTYECVYARADFSFIIIIFFLIFFSLLSMKAYKRAFFLRRKKIYNKIHNKLKYESFETKSSCCWINRLYLIACVYLHKMRFKFLWERFHWKFLMTRHELWNVEKSFLGHSHPFNSAIIIKKKF